MTTTEAAPITLNYLEALLIASHESPPPAAPQSITVQAVKAKPAPLLLPPTFEERLLWLSVEGYLKGDADQQEFARRVHATLRENEALRREKMDTTSFLERMLDLSQADPAPREGFAKMKAPAAKAAAEEYYKSLLYIGERISERIHG